MASISRRHLGALFLGGISSLAGCGGGDEPDRPPVVSTLATFDAMASNFHLDAGRIYFIAGVAGRQIVRSITTQGTMPVDHRSLDRPPGLGVSLYEWSIRHLGTSIYTTSRGQIGGFDDRPMRPDDPEYFHPPTVWNLGPYGSHPWVVNGRLFWSESELLDTGWVTVFWTLSPDGTAQRVGSALLGGVGLTKVFDGQVYFYSVRFDEAGDFDETTSGFYRVAVAGGEPQMLLRATAQAGLGIGSVDFWVHAGSLFYTMYGGAVWMLDLAAREARRLVAPLDTPHLIPAAEPPGGRVIADARHVYWSSSHLASEAFVRRFSRTTGEVTEVVRGGHVMDLALDGDGVYWATRTAIFKSTR